MRRSELAYFNKQMLIHELIRGSLALNKHISFLAGQNLTSCLRDHNRFTGANYELFRNSPGIWRMECHANFQFEFFCPGKICRSVRPCWRKSQPYRIAEMARAEDFVFQWPNTGHCFIGNVFCAAPSRNCIACRVLPFARQSCVAASPLVRQLERYA
jgi:hypothetical protein